MDKKNSSEDIQEHFRINSYVDLAINYDMENQFISKSQIRKADYLKKKFMLYQPASQKVRKGQTINISTLHLREKRLSLYGKVSRAELNFFILEYEPDINLINLRRGFREDPKILFDIKGQVDIGDSEKIISDNFILKDISITGVGFLSKGYEWDKDYLNKRPDINGNVYLNFINKKTQFVHKISGKVNLVRIISMPNGFLEGYEFIGEKSGDISKIVMDSQLEHRQAETRYYH